MSNLICILGTESVQDPTKVEVDIIVEIVGFRWFKFTLKPPYTITSGNLLSAIWDTSHWFFFGQIWTQDSLRHLL